MPARRKPSQAGGELLIEGTPWFMPPEAIQGSAPADPRSDLYSLGRLGYYLLTGHYIFDAETIAEIHEKQLTAVPEPPSQRTTNPSARKWSGLFVLSGERHGAASAIRRRIAGQVAGHARRRRLDDRGAGGLVGGS